MAGPGEQTQLEVKRFIYKAHKISNWLVNSRPREGLLLGRLESKDD